MAEKKLTVFTVDEVADLVILVADLDPDRYSKARAKALILKAKSAGDDGWDNARLRVVGAGG